MMDFTIPYLASAAVSGAIEGTVLSIPLWRSQRLGRMASVIASLGVIMGVTLLMMGLAMHDWWGYNPPRYVEQIIATLTLPPLAGWWGLTGWVLGGEKMSFSNVVFVFSYIVVLALIAWLLWWSSSPAQWWHLPRFRSSANMPGRRET